MSRKTLKLPEEVYERHNKRRKELGLTWSQYVDGQEPDSQVDYDRIREVVREEVRSELRDKMVKEASY